MRLLKWISGTLLCLMVIGAIYLDNVVSDIKRDEKSGLLHTSSPTTDTSGSQALPNLPDIKNPEVMLYAKDPESGITVAMLVNQGDCKLPFHFATVHYDDPKQDIPGCWYLKDGAPQAIVLLRNRTAIYIDVEVLLVDPDFAKKHHLLSGSKRKIITT